MQLIDYSELTAGESFSRLYLDYLGNYASVEQYFGGNFRDSADWGRTLANVGARTMNRAGLVQILQDQNRDFHCGIRTLANIDHLINDNALAVVSGQQVGLFTGPLYTVYKALTAVKLAQQLSEAHPDYEFVPVFWLEGEDHDVDEVTQVSLFNRSNELVDLRYEVPGRATGKNLGPVGPLEFGDTLESFFVQLEQALLPTEFTPRVLDLFRTAYQPGMTFTRAFVHLFNVLFEDSGLVFFDPHDARAKRMLMPVFKREITGESRTCQLVIGQSESLENHYHAQVKPRPINLFLFHGGGRFAIEPHTDGFSLKGTRQTFSREEMIHLVESEPEKFSPNVVLRPICQDALFPTAAYVAGPSEIAYFAQFKPLYAEFSIPEPIIYPRASVTVLEERVEKIIQRYQLRLADFGRDVESLKEQVASQISELKLDDVFQSVQADAARVVSQLRPTLQALDPTLLPPLENTISKSAGNLQLLKEKAVAAQKRQHEAALRQIDKASASLFPGSALQERRLNIIYFLNKYGLEFIRWLNGEIVIDRFKHQVVTL